MRIWDVDPVCLCRSHLLGEHGELHALWSILTQNKRGFADHPEIRRWRGKLAALYRRHEALVEEMTRRGTRPRRRSIPHRQPAWRCRTSTSTRLSGSASGCAPRGAGARWAERIEHRGDPDRAGQDLPERGPSTVASSLVSTS